MHTSCEQRTSHKCFGCALLEVLPAQTCYSVADLIALHTLDSNMAPAWKQTEWKYITVRNLSYRVILPGAKYIGLFGSVAEALECVKKYGYEPVQTKANREPMEDFLQRLSLYLDLLPKQGWLPGDVVVHNEVRHARPHLTRIAPTVYSLGIEGKEEPFWNALLKAYDALAPTEQQTLTMLTSFVDAERDKASRIFFKVYQDALTRMSTPAFRKRRSWWAGEVQFNISHQSGWLIKATTSKAMVKSTRGPLHLGEMGHRYKLLPWSKKLSKKHAEKARAIVKLNCLPPPTTFSEYEARSETMETCGYHNLWFNRSDCEAEREAMGKTNVLSVPENITCERFVKVFPDSAGWLKKLSRHFGTTSVKQILAKIGYTKRNLPISHFTMHLCFNGQLRRLCINDLRKLKKITCSGPGPDTVNDIMKATHTRSFETQLRS